ncbi:MAG: ccsA [Gemmataceae bacterium]|nr:ccsA [Gemmataceae bacterium]
MSTTIAEPDASGAGEHPSGRPAPGPGYYVYKGFKALASLQLTVGLFALSILLVFFGTLAQVDFGIWTVVEKYFWSWYVLVPFDLFNKFGQVFFDLPKGTYWAGSFPFPAGKVLGGAMLVNLLTAHALRFRVSWKRSGVLLLHSGLVLLFVGEFVTREFAVEQQMVIEEGKSANYSVDSRNYELAVVDRSDPSTDTMTVIPASALRAGAGRITHPDLPVDLEIVKYMVNSALEKPAGRPNPATAGHAVQAGGQRIAVERGEVSGVDPNQKVDIPSAYVKFFKKGTDQVLGIYLLSLYLKDDSLTVDGKTYDLSLRSKRYYKPFSISLVKFRFDRYPGTNKPKNYSSEVKILDKDGAVVREQTIRMNEPLRYEGETYYQSNFDKTETTTVLQVVNNPGWRIPYTSCVMVTLGLLAHFGVGLVSFLTRLGRGPTAGPPQAGPVAPEAADAGPGWLARNYTWLIPCTMTAVAALYLLSVYGRMKPKDQFDLDGFARIPVLEGGRVKPLDTVARVYLRSISGKSVFEDANGDEQPAIRWYLDTLGAKPADKSDPAWSHRIIRVDNEQVLAELKLTVREGLRYSVNELRDRDQFQVIDSKAKAARAKKMAGKPLDLTETKMLELAERLSLVMHVAQGRGHDTPENKFHLLPPQSGGIGWASLGEFREAAEDAAYTQALAAARTKVRSKPGGFNAEDEQRLLAHMLDGNPDRIPPERRAVLVKMVMDADPSMLPEGAREEVFGAVLSLLPQQDQDDARRDRETDLRARLAANPAAAEWDRLIEAHRRKNPDKFNSLVGEYRSKYLAHIPAEETRRAGLEITYNRFSPFLRCVGLYVLAFVLGVLGFALKAAELPRVGDAFRRSATRVLLLTLVVHTAGLLTRMYLSDRWFVFVTNLYSSAIFIGWGCVALGLILERVYPIGIGNVVAAVLGVATTIVAHNLATEDTLEMMQAVLDTNFWLATHVTTVTLGYTATFVAGFLGVVYVLQMLASVIRDSFHSPEPPAVDSLLAYGAAAAGIVAIPLLIGWVLLDALTKFEVVHSAVSTLLRFGMIAVGGLYFLGLLLARATADAVDAHGEPVPAQVPGLARPVAGLALTPELSKTLGQMIYGVVCFATLLSFVGTVLGGIWADQSWGRFWGWDPKENGAVLIVLWNSLILHARWCGLVKTRGVAVLAIVGNIITAWSWFGTNQLGIGLHAYGFDTRLADGCANFWLSMAVVIGVGLIPQQYWPSDTRRAGLAASAPVPAAPAGSAAHPAPDVNGSVNGHAPGSVKGRKPGKRR